MCDVADSAFPGRDTQNPITAVCAPCPGTGRTPYEKGPYNPMSSDDSCLPEIRAGNPRRRGRIMLIIVILMISLAYSPAMLYADVPAEVVVVTAPAVIGLAVEVVRRIISNTWPSSSGATTASA